MDIPPSSDRAADPLDVRSFSKAIEAQHGEISEAVRKMGMQRDEPLSNILSAVIYAQRQLSAGTMDAVGELGRITAGARLAAEHEVSRQAKIQQEAVELNADLRRAVATVVEAAQQERRDLHKNMLGEILPKLWKELDKAVVIRERRHNYVTLMSGAVVVAGVVTAAFLVGVCSCLWGDWRGSERLYDLDIALARCEVATPIVDAHGTRYCELNPLLPKRRQSIRADEEQTPVR